jgi:hypothetical protein
MGDQLAITLFSDGRRLSEANSVATASKEKYDEVHPVIRLVKIPNTLSDMQA